MVASARSFFDQHDDDGDGRIDVDELTKVLSDLGLRGPNESDTEFRGLVTRAMREHDANADGTLSFAEFKEMYSIITGVDVEDRREAASGQGIDARALPTDTFTAIVPQRDPNTGGITTPIENDFTFTQTIGTGGFAVVKKARHKATGNTFAVKIINVTETINETGHDDRMTMREIAEEIRLTMSFGGNANANVVKVHDFYVKPGQVYVVMELLEGGDLLDAISNEGAFSESNAAIVLHKLLTGLTVIHGKAMAHRDLKLENLIFKGKGRVALNGVADGSKADLGTLRIADFGLAKKMKSARARLTAQCGTPQYIAPEVVLGEEYTPSVDMWAAGVILYATVTGELPFDHREQSSSFKLIRAGKFHAPHKRVTPEFTDLLEKLLCVDKVKRLTAHEALLHPFFGKHLGTTLKDNNANQGNSEPLQNSSLRSFNQLLAQNESSPGARVTRAATKLGDDLPQRLVRKGELLIKKGDVSADEIFLIKKGRVQVEVVVNGELVVVATRGANEFVGEMGADIDSEGAKEIEDLETDEDSATCNNTKDNRSAFDARAQFTDRNQSSPTAWISGRSKQNEIHSGSTPHENVKRRAADVRAVEDVTVAVMTSTQMRWLLEHDYGADSELTSTVKDRRAELERATHLEKDKRIVPFSEQTLARYEDTPSVRGQRY